MPVQTFANPQNPAHLMHVRPVAARVRVTRQGEVLADSTSALRVMETGREPYDPVLYLPRDDVAEALVAVAGKTSHCPLKGDAVYFSHDGEVVAWSYDRPLPSGEILRDRVAFYADKVTIQEIGAAQ